MENNQDQRGKVFISSRKSLTFQKIHVIIRDERFTNLSELHEFLNYLCNINVGQFGDFKGFQL